MVLLLVTKDVKHQGIEQFAVVAIIATRKDTERMCALRERMTYRSVR